MDAHSSTTVSAAPVVAGGLGLATLQFLVARHGMQAAAEADGLDGIGVAVEYLAGEVWISLAALLIGARALRVRHWVLTAIGVGIADLALVTYLFQYVPGDDQRGWPGAVVFAGSLLVPAVIAWRFARTSVKGR